MCDSSCLLHQFSFITPQLTFTQHRKFSTSNKARSLSNLAVIELHIKVKAVLFSDYPIPSQNRGIVIAQAIST